MNRLALRCVAGAFATGLLLLMLAGCGGGGGDAGQPDEPGASTAVASTAAGASAGSIVDPADFAAVVDNRFLPLSSVHRTVLEGTASEEDTGEPTKARVESSVLEQTDVVAGVTVTVVEVKDYEDGELVEHTFDYYAQRQDGSVWYFGERVENYEGGTVVDNEGQWLAGEGGAQPGLFMPATVEVGQEFQQEQAPGVAEDQSTVVAVGLDVTTPAGTFSDCIKTKDVAPLDNTSGFQYYCPGVGLVREEFPGENIELVEYS